MSTTPHSECRAGTTNAGFVGVARHGDGRPEREAHAPPRGCAGSRGSRCHASDAGDSGQVTAVRCQMTGDGTVVRAEPIDVRASMRWEIAGVAATVRTQVHALPGSRPVDLPITWTSCGRNPDLARTD